MYLSARNSKSLPYYSFKFVGASWLYRQTLNPTQGWATYQPQSPARHSLLATRQASIVIRGDRYVEVPELVRAVWGAGARNGLPLDGFGVGPAGSFGGFREYEYERAGEDETKQKPLTWRVAAWMT